MCWHSWLERWLKHLPYFSICSCLPTLQCNAATTHNCELTWILSECHPATFVDCIVLPSTFQFLSKPWKIFASACAHICTHTHTHCPCLVARASRLVSLNIQQAGLNNQNMLKKYITRWAEDPIRFGRTAYITTVVEMLMQDKPETCVSIERSHLRKSTHAMGQSDWCIAQGAHKVLQQVWELFICLLVQKNPTSPYLLLQYSWQPAVTSAKGNTHFQTRHK